MPIDGGGEQIRTALTRPVVAGVVLLLVYVALSFLNSTGGYLGTDTGAKVYTLEVMAQEESFSPDIGYWAEEHDPSGSLHPVHQTRRQDDGSWVGITTLPMLELAQPLYRWGGYRATLLLPMIGAVAAAFAARQLVRRLSPPTSGWAAFWIVGLGSPLAVYALDFWEHSVGVACVVWAVVVFLGVLDERPAWTAVFAGALLGAGSVLRQEVLVYTLIATLATCGLLLVRRRSWMPPALTGVYTVGGFAVSWVLNALLEAAVSGQSRAGRSTGTAGAATSASASTVVQRLEEGLQTLFGLVSGDPVTSAFMGAVVVGAVLLASRAEGRGDVTFARFALVAAGAVYLADAVGGLGFIPGMLTAFPLAIGGLLAWNASAGTRTLVGIAVAALPLVYAFQYLNGASPQWAGRYTLASGSMLGIVALASVREHRPYVLKALTVLSVGVTALGIAWLVERSHGVDDFFDEVVAESEPVLIVRQAFLIREAGADAVGRRWLSVESEAEFTRAVEVARTIGEDRFSVLEWEGRAPPDESLPDDVREVAREELSAVGTLVGLVTYEFID